MSERSERTELENDPGNPCVGCGPENPSGLRLRFWREGEVVTAGFVAASQFQGWPGRLHSGILYLALLETANWTVYAQRGRVGLPVQTTALVSERWIAVGETLRLTGRAVPAEGAGIRILAEARDERGHAFAHLEREYELPSRAVFLQRMGYARVPPELEGALPAE